MLQQHELCRPWFRTLVHGRQGAGQFQMKALGQLRIQGRALNYNAGHNDWYTDCYNDGYDD